MSEPDYAKIQPDNSFQSVLIAAVAHVSAHIFVLWVSNMCVLKKHTHTHTAALTSSSLCIAQFNPQSSGL